MADSIETEAPEEPTIEQFAGRIVGMRWVPFNGLVHNLDQIFPVNGMVLEQGEMWITMKGKALTNHDVRWRPVPKMEEKA